MANTVTPALQEINKLTDQWEKSFKSIDAIALDISNKLNKIAKTDSSGLTSSEVEKRLKKNAEAVKILNQQLENQKKLNKQLQDQLNKLAGARKKNNQRTTEEIENQKILARNARVSARANSTLATSYEKASAKLIILRRRYKDLATNQALGNKLTKQQVAEMKRLQIQANKLDGALKKIDQTVGQSQKFVDQYGRAFKGLNKIVRASIIAFGLYSAIDIAKSIFRDVKAIDSMNKSLKQVTETTEEFNQAKGFISELAEEGGVDIVGLTQAYTKFLASAKTTNLTLEQTQNIFRQVAKAGAVLGLSTDDINGSFRALEQILSKGKVQAEEIRGQLGERLPGAFQILARSMGLTTAELSKQLELGNVLSEEVLPKFADELEKTYSLDKVDRVETLVSAQNRLGNSWTEFVENVESGSGVITKSLISIFGALSSLIEGWSILNLSVDEYNEKLKNDIASDSFKDASKQIRDEAEATGKSVSEVAKIYKEANEERLKQLEAEEKGLRSNKARLEEQIRVEVQSSTKIIERNKQIEEYDDRLRENIKTQGIYNGIVQASNSLIEENTDGIEGQNAWLIKTISNRSKEFTIEQLSKKSKEELLEILSKLNKKNGDNNGKIEKQITLLDALTKAEKAYSNEIKKRFASGASEGFESASNETIIEGLATPDDQEIIEGLNKTLDNTKNRIKAIKEAQTELAKQELLFEAFGRLEETLGIQAGTFETLFEQIGDGFEDISASAQAFGEIAKGAFAQIQQASNARLESQIKNLEEEKETALAFAGESAFAREQIEENFDKKQQALREKQAKADKNAALFQVAIDTALGIVNAASKVATIPLIPVIAGIGLAQAAIIASQPIPEFKEGHFAGTYEGLAKINDAKSSLYREIVLRKGGKAEMYDGRDQIINMQKGDKVLPAPMSASIVAEQMMLSRVLENLNISRPQGNSGISKSDLRQVMNETLSKQPQNSLHIDEKGFTKVMRKAHVTTIVKNSEATFKGGTV